VAELSHDDVKKILEIIDGMRDCEVHLEIGELKLHVTRDRDAVPRAPAPPKPPPPAVSPPSPAVHVPAGQFAVRAPTMGTFYRGPSPGAPPCVEIGARVAPDDTVGVFEVMKLFSSLRAGIAGTVSSLPVANETLVEQDQPLVLITPAG
jgi:acetyl-CoA carboxylase biotin carboxyl carrier protein